jgi:Tol biopolymer transport system component
MRRRGFLLSACAAALPGRAANPGLGTIAYLQADGLWVRSLPDGPRHKVAESAKNPRFSPSGEWIAFTGGVVPADGTARAALPPGRNVWLPRQDVLAVETEGGFSLFSPQNGWSAPTVRRTGAGLGVFNAEGSQLAFCQAVRTGTGPGAEPVRNGELRVATISATESRSLLSRHLILPMAYAWTRDSRYVLYWEDPDFSASLMADGLALFRVPAAGGAAQPLGVTTLVHEDLLALSPTSNKLAVTAGGGREIYERKRIAIIDLDSLAIRYVTGTSTSAMAPAWSQDGRRIAYVQAPAPPTPGPQYSTDNVTARPYMAQRRIWIADASGAIPPYPITADVRYRDEEPLWSADGTHILIGRLDASGTRTLWLMGAAGENPVQVSDALLQEDRYSWAGYYGYIDWRSAFDWHRP